MKQILVVDDDNWMAEHISDTLNSAGYLTVVSNDGYNAIDRIDDNIPDAIILDVLLPGANGFALLHELQSYADTCSIPVILCTTISNLDSPRDSLWHYGVRRFLDKATMTNEDIVASVRAVL